MKLNLQVTYWLMIGLLLLAGLGLVVTPALAEGGLPDRNPPPAAKESDDNSQVSLLLFALMPDFITFLGSFKF